MGSDWSKSVVGKAGTAGLKALRWHFSRGTAERSEKRGEALGRLAWRLDKRRRQTAMQNLELAMPELAEKEEIVRRVFEGFGRTTADFLRQENRNLARITATTEVEGKEHLDACVAEGKGTILVTGHIGNWERAAVWISHQHPMSVIARPANDPATDELINGIRKDGGYEVIPRGDSARQIIQTLKRNEILGILCDQNAQDIYIPFFGHQAGTAVGPGAIAERVGCPLLPMTCTWQEPGRYRIRFYPPFHAPPKEGAKGEATMRLINGWLEEVIRENPAQWLWIHDRWRSARRKGLL